MAQTILEKKNKVGKVTFPEFNTPYKATSRQNRSLGLRTDADLTEQNREPINEPSRTWWVKLSTRMPNHSVGGRESFQQMILGKLDFHVQQNDVNAYLTPETQISSTWIKDLNTGAETSS